MATRKVIDCRDYPGSECSLMLAGTEEEVLDAAVQHATARHGYPNTPDLRDKLRGMLKSEAVAAAR